MKLINVIKLVYEYVKRDDDGNKVESQRAIDEVDLNIEEGSFIAILGHNGSGKSTLAKHLNGILFPNSGSVIVSGVDTMNEELIFEVRKNVGMVFQNPDNQIIGNIVDEDVAFGPENIGVPTDDIILRVDEALKSVDMYEYKEKSPNRLSGGQKQRVAIAGIMAMKPKCIVFDEPTAMLDPKGRKEVVETAKKLNREEGITIIFITHYMEEVIDADRVIVMDKGKIVMDDVPKVIFSDVEKLKDYRLNVPQVTQLAYELKKEGIDIPDGIIYYDELAKELNTFMNRGV